MAVIKTIVRTPARSGKIDSKGTRSYERHFTVITNDAKDGPVVIWTALGFSPFDVYAGSSIGNDVDVGARIADIETRQTTNDPFTWEVIVHFESTAKQQQQDPLARPTKIYYGFTRYNEVMWRDVTGKAVLNSAGFYFDPPPEVDRSRLLVKFVRNEAVFNLFQALAYQDAVNSDLWFGVAPTLARCQITGDPQEENGEEFYSVTYEMEIRWDGWTVQLLDQGRYQLPVSAGKGTKINDQDNDPVTDPWPLDGTGHAIAVPTVNNAVFLPFVGYRAVPFSALFLP